MILGNLTIKSLFKIVSVFMLSLVCCYSANSFWTRHKKPLEQEFRNLLEEYSVAKKNYDNMEEHSRSWRASLDRLKQVKKPALDNNPELEAKYSNWRKINRLLVAKHTPQNKYEVKLRKVNELLKGMIETLNEVKDMEVKYQGLIPEKENMLMAL